MPLPPAALYCCPDPRGGCRTTRNRATTTRRRFAFATLLMLGDGYLPGALLVGEQLRALAPGVDRICMVTPDVNAAARASLSAVFTRVREVPYISVAPVYIKRDSKLARVYSHTFTKINVLGLGEGEYDKIAYIDADMMPLSEKVTELFDAATPAGVYVGCFRPWHDPASLAAFKRSVACRLDASRPIPADISKRAGCRPEFDIGVETSVMVVRPDAAEHGRLIALLREIETTRPMAERVRILKGDTSFLNFAWAGKWHPLDVRYLARWVGDEHDEVWIADAYGSLDGKPWDAKTPGHYPDVRLWRALFAQHRSGKIGVGILPDAGKNNKRNG